MIFLLLIAFTKRAQIPFSIWLSMAMKDPTSVSFLIHSSILITAGIYLSIRYVDLLERKYKNIILLISKLTILFAEFHYLKILHIIWKFWIRFKKKLLLIQH